MFSIGHPQYWLWDPPGLFPAYEPKFPSANALGYDYLAALTLQQNNLYGDFLYDAWIYLLILVVAIVVLFRRRPADRVLAALALGMILYELVLEFTGPGEVYRYLYPMVATGTVLAPVLIPRHVVARLASLGRRPSHARSHR
jgi:hypothetical protein